MPAEIAIGSYMLLATTNLHLKTVGTCKLIPRWVGPFKVTPCLGGMSYCLDLPAYIHRVICIFLIKQYRSDGRTQPPPPPELVDYFPEWTVEQILDHKTVHRGNQLV